MVHTQGMAMGLRSDELHEVTCVQCHTLNSIHDLVFND